MVAQHEYLSDRQLPTPSHEGQSRVTVFVTLIAFYGGVILLSSILFVAVIDAPVFKSFSILFYRGVIALAAIALALPLLLLLSLRLPWPPGILAGRDAFVATALATALNLTFFVLGPVTSDRSITVFMLSRLAAAPAPLTTAELELSFTEQYVCAWNQIGRRLDEQIASGNVTRESTGYRLTPQGQALLRSARMMSRLFGGDPRFAGLEPPLAVASADIGPGRRAPSPSSACKR